MEGVERLSPTTPSVSVIMLTYNREKLVSRAVTSILSQTFDDFEFIIVDNGSADRSGFIADEYAAKDNRIRVIHRERGNIGSGRNAGLDASRGEYIAFVDDDDWAEPDYLEFLYGLAKKNDAEFVICGAADKAFDEYCVMTPEEAVIELLWRRRYNVAFPAKLIARRLFDCNRFPDTGKFDDIALMPKIMAGANKVVYHGLPKYTFDRHEGNNSSWTTNHKLITPDILDEYLAVYRERTKWLCEVFPNSASAWRYFEWSFMISMVDKVTQLELRECAKQLKVMTAELREQRDAFYDSGLILDFEKEWVGKYIGLPSS
jgi:glycosyltransferase involved in cell wall biosynthesis